MAWWKQILLTALVLAGVAAAWLRFDPSAAERFAAAGVPEGWIALVAGPASEEGSGEGGRGGWGGRGGASLVVTSEVGTASINDRITAIGDSEALQSVVVVPLDDGVIEVLNIAPGQSVQANDVLAVLESEAETNARDKAALDVEVAADALQRTERLAGSNAASGVQVTNARNELQRARLALRDAEIALSKRSIKAPINGSIGLVPVEVGDYVTTQSEIATIDDRSKILVDFWIPERFAARVNIGQRVSATAIALPDLEISGEVSAIASRIERDSRTLQVRAMVDNPDRTLLPGMSFRLTLRFDGEPFPAIDPLALQWSSGGPYLWKVVEGKSQRVDIRIIQRNSDYVLVAGDVAPGDEVVTEGIQSLRQGSELNIARRTGAPASQGS